jgi:FG-GAP-like repeat
MFLPRCLLAAIVLLFITPLFGQGVLTYKEASNGLQRPDWEEGRTEIELGDVNGDGNVDILSIGDHGSPFINTHEHGVMVWFGDGAGNWSLFQNGNFGYGGIAIGDVNNDGIMDIAYGMHHNYSSTHFGDRLEGVALGDGSGRRWRPWDKGVATNGETYGMFGTDLADVNLDGLLDLGSISFGCCSGVHVYLNNGDGTWTQSFGFLGGNSNEDFLFADFNGDGNPDIACASSNGTVFLGDGAGNFTPADGNLPPVPNVGRVGISVGDVNGDGRDDLAFVAGPGGLQVWSMVSDGVWQDLSGNLPRSGNFEATQLADMDLDGHVDLVAFGHGTVTIFTGDGQGNWTQAASFNTPGRQGYAAFRAGTDVDHNGYPDIGIVAAEGSGNNRLRVYVEASTATRPAIYPRLARGGATLVQGSARRLEWTAAVPPGYGPATVSLDVSTGSSGPWRNLAADLPNNGVYQWRVPTDLQSNCFIRYRLMLGGRESARAVSPRPYIVRAAK